MPRVPLFFSFFFFFNDTATTEIYTLSLHDALPISPPHRLPPAPQPAAGADVVPRGAARRGDRKSTRLNSSHTVISYAVFCLKKKTNTNTAQPLCSQDREDQCRYIPTPHSIVRKCIG